MRRRHLPTAERARTHRVNGGNTLTATNMGEYGDDQAKNVQIPISVTTGMFTDSRAIALATPPAHTQTHTYISCEGWRRIQGDSERVTYG